MKWLQKGRGEVGFSLHGCTQTCSGQMRRMEKSGISRRDKGRGDAGFSLHGCTQTWSGQKKNFFKYKWRKMRMKKGRGDVGFSLHGCSLMLVRPDEVPAERQG